MFFLAFKRRGRPRAAGNDLVTLATLAGGSKTRNLGIRLATPRQSVRSSVADENRCSRVRNGQSKLEKFCFSSLLGGHDSPSEMFCSICGHLMNDRLTRVHVIQFSPDIWKYSNQVKVATFVLCSVGADSAHRLRLIYLHNHRLHL